ncbi:polysaccharide biosynthesis C-terminal domain-containing protein [Flavobacterium branchiophilum]|nr:polysaccharide biosynthesis C-terminal domain-containing protein [Flavobacterium branchiophilum]
MIIFVDYLKKCILSLFKNLFKQTMIYGLATVLPRMFSFILVPLYTTQLPRGEYGQVTVLFAYLVFLNVILSYGMETAFFRFYNTETDKKNVIATSTISIFWTSLLFLLLGLVFRKSIANFIDKEVQYITYSIWILVLDALVIIPFSKLRATQKPIVYALIKIGNVLINMGLNIFLLIYLPQLAAADPEGFWNTVYLENFQIGYIFMANVVASLATFIILSPHYFTLKWHFDVRLWLKMMQYGLPILIAGIAFAINEHLDKIILEHMLPKNSSEVQVGMYAACYKIGLFMVLYRTAYSLGIEPFFFSHANSDNPQKTYATITKYFVIFGSLIQLTVIVFADLLKIFMIRDASYWEAMDVVPLIILANFFLGIYTNLSVWYKLTNQTHFGAYISIAGAVITLILNYLLIPKIGYYGAAVATIAAYGTMMFISYYYGNKYYPIPYESQKIYGYLAVSIVFSILSFYVFRANYFVGIPLIFIFLIFIYVNEKNTLLSLLNRKKNNNIT